MKEGITQTFDMAGRTYRITRMLPDNIVKKPEDILKAEVVLFIIRNFPDAIHRGDVMADLYAAPQVISRVRAMYRHTPGYPDLFIAEPRMVDGVVSCGLYLELKAKRSAVLTKAGQLKADPHVVEQELMMQRLRQKGYSAAFAWGDDDHVFKLIAGYMG